MWGLLEAVDLVYFRVIQICPVDTKKGAGEVVEFILVGELEGELETTLIYM